MKNDEESNNIVVFPVTKRNCPPNNMEDIMREVKQTRESWASIMARDTTLHVLGVLHQNGVDVLEEDNHKLYFMMMQTILAIIQSNEGIYHVYRKFSDETITIGEDDKFMEILKMHITGDEEPNDDGGSGNNGGRFA